MDVSVIIVNYKTIDMIIDCIESVIMQTKDLKYEIIVVDNNSDDNFEQRLYDRFKSLQIKCLPLDRNLGFGLANNEGSKIACGRNLLFLNPDTILLNNAIKLLSDYIDSHVSVGVCGGNLYDINMNPTNSFDKHYPSLKTVCYNSLLGTPIKKSIKNRIFNNTKDAMSVAYISGADMMMPKKLFDRLGGFSSDFFMYYEETDLCFRVQKAGYDIKSIPTAKIQHLEGASFTGNVIKQGRIILMEASRKIFLNRNYPVWYVWLINLIYVLDLYIRRMYYWLVAGCKSDVKMKIIDLKINSLRKN